MVSSRLIKLGTPFTRSSLLGLSIALMINAIFLIVAGWQYPFLIGHDKNFYIEYIGTISLVLIGVSLSAIGIAISGSIISYKYDNNYLLVHAGLTAIFLPVLILVFFGSLSTRYRPRDHKNFKQMIINYRIVDDTNTNLPLTGANDKLNDPSAIDAIQSNFTCCGFDFGVKDWIQNQHGYIPASCCKEQKRSQNKTWSELFKVSPDYEFIHCEEVNSYELACLTALEKHENIKYSWTNQLLVIMIVIIVGETIDSFLLFGLTKSDKDYNRGAGDLSMIGVMATMQHRSSTPNIIEMKSRPSVVFSLSNAPSSSEQLFSARLKAIRANLNNNNGQGGPIYAGPRALVSGPSKFSPAARRGSSFI